MGILSDFAEYRAWKDGVVHTTFNPEGPGAVRIHLIPPKWKLFTHQPYVVILNGYYLLPMGHSWALLLRYFIQEINRHEGQAVTDGAAARAAAKALNRLKLIYHAPRGLMEDDLRDMLSLLSDIARGKEPSGGLETMTLREYAPHMSAPHRMDLLVSPMTKEDGAWNCNLRCLHCYAAGQEKAAGTQLTTEEWKHIIDRCRKARIPQLTFTGGEPTMLPDLPELIEHARWFVTRLNTNGILLTPPLCEQLKKASLDSVQITLYSSDPAVHNRLTGGGSQWKKTVSGLKNALDTGLDISVNTPLCRDNQDYIPTLQFLSDLGITYVSCSGLIETGCASSDGSLSSQLSMAEMGDILKEAAAFCKIRQLELQFTSPGRADPQLLKQLGLSVPMCGACLSNMAITPDGSVVPCQSWLSGHYTLGSMQHDSWPEIWNSPLCKKIRTMPEEDTLLCPLRSSQPEQKGEHS